MHRTSRTAGQKRSSLRACARECGWSQDWAQPSTLRASDSDLFSLTRATKLEVPRCVNSSGLESGLESAVASEREENTRPQPEYIIKWQRHALR